MIYKKSKMEDITKKRFVVINQTKWEYEKAKYKEIIDVAKYALSAIAQPDFSVPGHMAKGALKTIKRIEERKK